MVLASRHRRGMAPLELAMLFPLLILLVVSILWVGRGGSARIAALADARGTTWNERESALPGLSLRLEHRPLTSLVEHQASTAVPGHAVVAPGPLSALGYNGTTFNNWDHQEIEFERLPEAEERIIPHIRLLELIGQRNPETLSLYASLIPGVRSAPIVHPMKNASVRQFVARHGPLALANRRVASGILVGWAPLQAAMAGASAELAYLASLSPINAAYYGPRAAIVAYAIATQSLPRLAEAHGVK